MQEKTQYKSNFIFHFSQLSQKNRGQLLIQLVKHLKSSNPAKPTKIRKLQNKLPPKNKFSSPEPNLRFQIGLDIELPVTVVWKRGRRSTAHKDAIGGRGVADVGRRRAVHARELMGLRRPPCRRIGDPTSPLKHESKTRESQRQNSKKKQKLGGERLRRRRRRTSERGVETSHC